MKRARSKKVKLVGPPDRKRKTREARLILNHRKKKSDLSPE